MNRTGSTALLAILLASSSDFCPNFYMGKPRDTNPLKLTPAQMDHLQSFPDTREGIKAKKKWLRSLRETR